MKSARRIVAIFVPTLALAATATVGLLPQTPESDVAQQPRSAAVNYTAGSPVGRLNQVIQVPGGVRAIGWALDPNVPTAALAVAFSIDHVTSKVSTASGPRADVARAYPTAGARHGFDLFIPLTEGRHSVCVAAKNLGRGINATVGCTADVLYDFGPYGSLDQVNSRPGHVHVSGWFIDADSPTRPVTVSVAVDGVVRSVVGSASRPDIGKRYPSSGADHGFAIAIPASQGSHKVCVTARSIGYGADNTFACRTVTVNDNPVGEFTVSQSAGKLRVYGFTVDRDAPATPLRIAVRVGTGSTATYPASSSRPDLAKTYSVPANHGFDGRLAVSDGRQGVCVAAVNVGYGNNASLGCRSILLDFRPKSTLTKIVATRTGLSVAGTAADPDTSAAVAVRLTLDGQVAKTIVANAAGAPLSGHNFAAALDTRSGTHTACAVAVNVASGNRDSEPACRTITLTLSPTGGINTVTRVGNNIRVTGWAFDPDTAAPATVTMTVDGKPAGTFAATDVRPEVAAAFPSAGAARGFSPLLTTTAGKHTVCVTAKNVAAGSDTNFGCRLVIAVNPKAPSAPLKVVARSGFGSLTVSWTPPSNDGGAPVSHYGVLVNPIGKRLNVSGASTSAIITGLRAKTTYRVTVTASNVAGTSPAGVAPLAITQSGPAPQTTPAPVSVSRYVRNIRTCSAAEYAEMKSFGRADAARNVSGHRYLMLLDIGGQNQRYGGVVLSATTRFVTYAALLSCSKAYVDGYAGAVRATAPAVIAIGVNNDMDVNATTGRDWATKIVNPLVSYAAKYPSIAIAGANDIEPGFSGTYSATRNWLTGYLAATKAKFIFNGSADGCAWTVTNRTCNNGWSMAGLYNLAAGMAPTQMINLPQIYNYTMADQWKYISLTGVGQSKPRINFGGPLTEVTACAQARSCDSINGRSAWQRLWNNLQSHPSLRVSSLPYATDLRIDN